MKFRPKYKVIGTKVYGKMQKKTIANRIKSNIFYRKDHVCTIMRRKRMKNFHEITSLHSLHSEHIPFPERCKKRVQRTTCTGGHSFDTFFDSHTYAHTRTRTRECTTYIVSFPLSPSFFNSTPKHMQVSPTLNSPTYFAFYSDAVYSWLSPLK